MRALVILILSLLLAWGVTLAGNQGGTVISGWPLLGACAAIAFGIQWLAWVPAAMQKNERFYDLTGSLTYLSVLGFALWAVPSPSARAYLIGGLCAIWALRLGTFLFRRIHKDGKDGRFDEIKVNPLRFFGAWTLQGLWVFLTLCAAITAIGSGRQPSLGWVAALGTAIWIVGFLIEMTADRQKSAFRANPDNKGQFIRTGLWAWSRHPNYFGEIVLWIGIFVLAAPTFLGWQWITVVSPIFVTLLLTKASGVPLLEKTADERWGGQEDYEAYKANTPVLIPGRPRRSGI